MKQIYTLLLFLFTIFGAFAQNTKNDTHFSNQNTVSKNESTQNGWTKIDNDASAGTNTPALGNENVSYYSGVEGIYVSISSGTNSVRLYALTGQLLSYGVLTTGRYFTAARRGIYFLKINNKTYKVICK